MLTPFTRFAADTHALVETLIGFLPVVLLLLVFYFILRRFQMRSPVVQLQKKYLEHQLEQMPRIEALLERIAKALERHQ